VALFVDPDARGNIDELISGADVVGGIQQGGVSGLRVVVKFTGRGLAPGILCGGD